MITIEEFIKHLENRGYEKTFDNEIAAHFINRASYEEKQYRFYNTIPHLTIVTEEGEYLYQGKIESLEQFDLIDRLTS